MFKPGLLGLAELDPPSTKSLTFKMSNYNECMNIVPTCNLLNA
jgi:hypothetical protein